MRAHAMLITDEMLQAGVKKAVELGLLPRKSIPEDIATNRELMLEILECAFEEMEHTPVRSIPVASGVDASL
jgi:hypothetical protein